MRARQTFLFVVKRAIYGVPKVERKTTRNRDWEIFLSSAEAKNEREREEDFQSATLNYCFWSLFLGKKRTTQNYLLLLGGVHTRTTSREAAARQTPSVCVKGG